MRILVYGDSAEAQELVDGYRGEGHKASLRTPFDFDPSQVEPCDQAVAWDAEIVAAYGEKGILVGTTEDAVEEVPEAPVEEVVEAPKRGKRSSL